MGQRQCPECGAYLDPGERCDCQEKDPEIAPAQSKENEEELWLVSQQPLASDSVPKA